MKGLWPGACHVALLKDTLLFIRVRPCGPSSTTFNRHSRSAKRHWQVVKRLSGLTRSGCQPVLKAIPRLIHIQSTCACFAVCIVHVFTNTTCNTINVDNPRRCQSPLCARICSLLARGMSLPARALRARMQGTCLHVPCPCLRVRSVCACLSCLFSLYTVDVGKLLRSDIALVRVFKGAPMAQHEHPAELSTVVVSFSG